MDGTLAWCNRLRVILGLLELIPSKTNFDGFPNKVRMWEEVVEE